MRKFRHWLIRLLAGSDAVVLNTYMANGEVHVPFGSLIRGNVIR